MSNKLEQYRELVGLGMEKLPRSLLTMLDRLALAQCRTILVPAPRLPARSSSQPNERKIRDRQ